MRPVATKAELLALTGGAPVVRYDLPDDIGPAFEHDGAVLFARCSQSGGSDLVPLGPDDGIVALLAARPTLPAPLSTCREVTVESTSRDALRRAGADDPDRWAMMTLTDDARLSPVTTPLVALGPERHGEVTAFLDEHYTSRWTTPGRLDGEHWLGAERDGRLLAVGCASLTPAGVARLGGITVAREARGLGLGRALTSALARHGLATTGVATLGIDEGNPAAEGLYLDLGFTTAHEWLSVELPA